MYATGRSLALYKELVNAGTPLPEPAALICSVGTRIYSGEGLHSSAVEDAKQDADWHALLSDGWDREAVQRAAERVSGSLTSQADSEQGEFKLSYVGDFDAVQSLRTELSNDGLDVKVIFSSGKDIDILPSNAGKGNAVRHLLKQYASADGLTYENIAARTLVCGDSGNDVAMLGQPGVKACIVGNAQQELLEWFKRECSSDAATHPNGRAAESILYALREFNLLASGQQST